MKSFLPARRHGAWLGATLALGSVLASAQQADAPAGAPPRSPAADIEPAVDTSVAAPAATPAAGRAGAQAAAPASAASTGATATTRGAEASPGAPAAPRPAARPTGRAMDRVDLEASQITGNRELPRVLYIVPWRAPQAGDLEGRPVNSLLYELTRPVDRDVFRRENRYFDALQAQSPNADAAASAPAVEK